MLTALPQTVSLSYSEVAYAMEKSLVKLDAALMKVLETMPPELYADIVKNGIYLAGGGALIRGLDKRLNAKTGIPFHIAEDPLRAIARGTGIALKNINRFLVPDEIIAPSPGCSCAVYKLIEFLRRIYVVALFIVFEAVAIGYYAHSSNYTQAKLLTGSNRVGGRCAGGTERRARLFPPRK